ncbi:MAG: sugar phosphate isomerase/epimerase [Flavobacteriaceae bacterium]|jgi:sugar phosphate isomerase/epimerase
MESTKKNLSRRSFLGTTATLAAGLSLAGSKLWGAPAYVPNLLSPNFTINGVQLGVITYSFREMENQSAEAILQYVLDCGVNSIELMGSTAESFNGRPENKMDRRKFYMLSRKARKNELNKDEEKEFLDLKNQEAFYDKEVEVWSKSKSLDGFTKLRKMYSDAGVQIYAFKPDYLLTKKNSDANIEYAMKAGKLLGASHVTLELPKDTSHTLKLGQMAEKNNIHVAYHGHEQQSPTWWDTALSQSPKNAMNIDLGHYVAAGNTAPLQILKDKHQHILSMHVKDRQNPENGKNNMPFGKGDTPIVAALQLMRDEKYTFAATIEYEYQTPENSSIIDEIKKSVAYCKDALES